MLIKDTAFGRVVNHLSNHRFFKQPEEKEDFIIPDKYISKKSESPSLESKFLHQVSDLEKGSSDNGETYPDNGGFILVEWYGDDDKENPRNWSFGKKLWTQCIISIFTAITYMGTSIYTPGIPEIVVELNTSHTKALVPLTVFVASYGIAPMVFAPMTEHPPFGRTWIFIITLFLYSLLQIPTALSNSIYTLIGLRILAGILASPVLATGAASCAEIFPHSTMYMGFLIWAWASSASPALGPFFGGLFTQILGWRWTFWFLGIATGAVLVGMCVSYPETSSENILYRRAERLRRITGNQAIRSQYEIDNLHHKVTVKGVLTEILWRPVCIAFSEPMVFFLNVYSGFIYVIINCWFEAFPIVFTEFYHFNLIETGITYMACIVGPTFGALIYYIVFNHVVVKKPEATIENFLIPAIVGSFFPPIGIFVFSWGSSTHTHWMAPVIGAGIFMCGCLIIFQSIFAYLGHSYVRFIASVFAGNCLMRSCMASVFPLFVGSMFRRLGTDEYPVGRGGSILGAISAIMILIPVCFYKFGEKFRGKSKYAN